MPTVVDELVLKLGLDASQYKVGQSEFEKNLAKTKNHANRAAKEMEADGKRAAEFFAQIKGEALSLIGVLAGSAGLGLAIKDSVTSMADLGRAAQNIRMSAQELGALQNVIERNGGSAQGVTNTLTQLQKVVQDIKTFGNGGHFFAFLNPIGAGQGDSPMQILTKYMRFVETHPKDVALQNQIGQGLGIDPDTILALRQIGSLTGLTRELGDALRDVPTEQQTKDAQELQKAWAELEQAAVGLRNSIVTGLTPALISASGWMKEEIRDKPQFVEALLAASAAVTGLGILRVSAKKMGFAELATTLDGILATVGRLSLYGLIAGGIIATDPGDIYGGPNDPAGQGPGFANSPFTHWWRRTMPSWAGGSPNAPTLTPPHPGSKAAVVMQQVHDFWISKGFTEDQVAGILAGGPAAESGFNPTAVGDNGRSYGLYQEHDDRMQRLFAKYGPSPTVAQQNEFAWEELNDPSRADALHALRTARTPGQSAAVWTGGFEVPADTTHQAVIRAAAAPAFVGASGGASNKTDVHIGSVTIHTKATDASGIARGFADALSVQANRGLIQ